MSDVIMADGTVLASSQFTHSEILKDQSVTTPMVGVILEVNPSDNEKNLSSAQFKDGRGYRHECRVLIVDANNQPNLILENVEIPPRSPSGIDNYEEHLPRGLAKELIDGKNRTEHFKGIDFSDLDAEFCIVNFIGGSIDKPFIQNWYYHPSNSFDPATSGSTTEGKTTLRQVDLNKNRFRKISRVNGVVYTVSTQGDVYVDTSESNRHIRISGKKPEKSWYVRGGSIQVDIKKTQQLEFNFNEPVEGLAAGSTSASQTRDPSKPHLNHTDSTPNARETSRTFLRLDEYNSLLKTSGLNLYCKTEGSNLGQAITLANDTVLLMQGDETVASVTLQEGRVQLIAEDGTTISLSNDQSIAIASPNGASISIDSSGKIALQGTNIDISGLTAIGGIAGEPGLLGTTVVTAISRFTSDIATALGIWAAITPPNPVSNGTFIGAFGAAAAQLAISVGLPVASSWFSKSFTTT